MGDTWQKPGKITEGAGGQLGAFGIKSLEGARVTMIDPPKRPRKPKTQPMLIRNVSGAPMEINVPSKPPQGQKKPKRRR